MASSIQLLRSTNPQERPFAGNLLEGQPAANLHSSEPGLFFKTTDGSIVKFGPAAITSDGSPPNSTPQGSSGNSVGELWLDKSFNPPVLRVYDGSEWVDAGSGGGGGGGSGSFVRWIYTAVGGETSLSGTSNGVLLEYTAGLEEVYVNGVLITRGTDYSAVNGTSITNLAPLTAGDIVTVLSMNPVETVQLPGQVTLLRWTILAAAGQTVLSGIDSSSQQLAYTAGFEEVYVNGAFLRRSVDYTATDGSTITISSPLTEDDEVTVMAWSAFEVGDVLVRNENVAQDANIESTKLSFVQSGAGAIERTVDSKLKEEVSVLDFIPTTWHDSIKNNVDLSGNATAMAEVRYGIQTALNSADSIFFPSGTYYVDRTLAIPGGKRVHGTSPGYRKSSGNPPPVGTFQNIGSRIVRVGSGPSTAVNPGGFFGSYKRGATTPTDLNETYAIFIVVRTTFDYESPGTIIENLTLSTINPGTAPDMPVGIYLFRVTNSRISNVSISGVWNGIDQFDSYVMLISRVTSLALNVNFVTGATSWSLENCYALGGSVGYAVDGTYTALTGCAADGQVDIAYWFRGGRGQSATGCGCEEYRGNAVRVDSVGVNIHGLNADTTTGSRSIPTYTTDTNYTVSSITDGTDAQYSVVATRRCVIECSSVRTGGRKVATTGALSTYTSPVKNSHLISSSTGWINGNFAVTGEGAPSFYGGVSAPEYAQPLWTAATQFQDTGRQPQYNNGTFFPTSGAPFNPGQGWCKIRSMGGVNYIYGVVRMSNNPQLNSNPTTILIGTEHLRNSLGNDHRYDWAPGIFNVAGLEPHFYTSIDNDPGVFGTWGSQFLVPRPTDGSSANVSAPFGRGSIHVIGGRASSITDPYVPFTRNGANPYLELVYDQEYGYMNMIGSAGQYISGTNVGTVESNNCRIFYFSGWYFSRMRL